MTTRDSSSIIGAACLLAAKGLPVFSLYGTVPSGSCICDKGSACNAPGKHPIQAGWQEVATTDEQIVESHFSDKSWANIGVATGRKISETSQLIVIDCDGDGGLATLQKLEALYGNVPKTYKISTGRTDGFHYYLTIPANVTVRNSTKTALGPGIDVRGKGGYVVGAGSVHANGREYKNVGVEEIVEAPTWLVTRLTEERRNAEPAAPVGDEIPEGMRNSVLFSLSGGLRRSGLALGAIRKTLGAVNEAACGPPLGGDELDEIAKSIGRYPPGLPRMDVWPGPARAEAFHGLAGDIVRAIKPHSEADPMALLLQTLAAFGNAAGRGAHMAAEGDEHPAGLFVVLAGETSKARKGTSWGRVSKLFEQADPDWLTGCVTSGAISGEGMVWEVRDPITTRTKPKNAEHDGVGEDGLIEEITEPGVQDKRRLWLASEFASILTPARRDSNTLSPVIRDAWDRPNWRTAAKNAPVRVTGAHTAIIAHITAYELASSLSAADRFNGFANRFLFACVKRSKCIPEPTQPGEGLMAELADKLRGAIGFAHAQREVVRDEQARTR